MTKTRGQSALTLKEATSHPPFFFFSLACRGSGRGEGEGGNRNRVQRTLRTALQTWIWEALEKIWACWDFRVCVCVCVCSRASANSVASKRKGAASSWPRRRFRAWLCVFRRETRGEERYRSLLGRVHKGSFKFQREKWTRKGFYFIFFKENCDKEKRGPLQLGAYDAVQRLMTSGVTCQF